MNKGMRRQDFLKLAGLSGVVFASGIGCSNIPGIGLHSVIIPGSFGAVENTGQQGHQFMRDDAVIKRSYTECVYGSI